MAIEGDFLFLAQGDHINVYHLEHFSGRITQEPASIFQERPTSVLRIPQTELYCFKERLSSDPEEPFCFNHVRSGCIGGSNGKPVLVAVGEWGVIAAWILDGDAKNWQLKMFHASTPESSWGIAFNPASPLLFVSSNAHAIFVFNFWTGVEVYSDSKTGEIHSNNIPSLDSRGDWLISASIDDSVAIWNFAKPDEPQIQSLGIIGTGQMGWLVRFIDDLDFIDSKQPDIERSYFDGGADSADESYSDSGEDIPSGMQFGMDIDGFEEADYYSRDYEYEYEDMDESLVEVMEFFNRVQAESENVPTFVEGAENGWPDSESESEGDNTSVQNLNHESFSSNSSNDDYSDDDYDSSDYSDYSDYSDSDLNDKNSAECIICGGKYSTDPFSIPEFKLPRAAPPFVYLSNDQVLFTNTRGDSRHLALNQMIHHCSAQHFTNPFLLSLRRLSMGQWLPELSLFLAINQQGFLCVMDLSTWVALQVPERSVGSDVVGYAVRLVNDAELHTKAQVFIMYWTGQFSIYEVSRL